MPGDLWHNPPANIGARLGALKGANELTLLGVEVGGRDLERARHGQFAPMRADGEWFIYGAPIIYHVMQLDQDVSPSHAHPGTPAPHCTDACCSPPCSPPARSTRPRWLCQLQPALCCTHQAR